MQTVLQKKRRKKKRKKSDVERSARLNVMDITDANECDDGREYTNEFRAARNVTNRPTLRRFVGSHFELCGDLYTADWTDLTETVRIGMTVRVDQDGRVLIQSDDDESIEVKIGDIDNYYPGGVELRPTNYFGIVWGRAYERLSGLADDEVDDEDPDYHGLYYDIVIIGSNSAWGYEQWDDLFGGMKGDLDLEN